MELSLQGQLQVWVRVRSSSVFSVFTMLELRICWTDRWRGLGCCAPSSLVLVLAPQGCSRGNQETRTLDQFEISSTSPSSHRRHRIRVYFSSLYRTPGQSSLFVIASRSSAFPWSRSRPGFAALSSSGCVVSADKTSLVNCKWPVRVRVHETGWLTRTRRPSKNWCLAA
jgi:hypothetical protein